MSWSKNITAVGQSYYWRIASNGYSSLGCHEEIVIRLDELSSMVEIVMSCSFVMSLENLLDFEGYMRHAIRVLQAERDWKLGSSTTEMDVIINVSKMSGRIQLHRPNADHPMSGVFSLKALRIALKKLTQATLTLKAVKYGK